ncbi:hypothetical protein [Niabella beijingensis]|uniref:hypothetical protein n=1 Tax=Niabella beijingensis TaxID=2872700 RepID=UPI001CBCDC72|nr:hypothetical protein [Niabella beijingensis]MBZ4190081.1 hypothetical protein [Niabella beijingensis]
MRYLLSFILFIWVGTAAAQDQFFKVVKDYFRVDPFSGQFSAFVDAVKTDPQLNITESSDKSDTSLFSVQGDYKSFNPFTIRANRIEVLLAEKKRMIRTAKPFMDTVVLYQITGFFDSTAETVRALKREYKKINKKIRRNLSVQGEAQLKNIKGVREGAITNHAMSASLAAPISVAWYVKDDGELALLVVLRMKYAGNRAIPSGMLYDYYYFNRSILQSIE